MDQTSASQKTKTLIQEKILLALICLSGLVGAFAIYMTSQSAEETFDEATVTITSQAEEAVEATSNCPCSRK